jgi:hypothetical protein
MSVPAHLCGRKFDDRRLDTRKIQRFGRPSQTDQAQESHEALEHNETRTRFAGEELDPNK